MLIEIIVKPSVTYLLLFFLYFLFRKKTVVKRVAISLNIIFALLFLKLFISGLIITDVFPTISILLRDFQCLLYVNAFLLFFVTLLFFKVADLLIVETYLIGRKSKHIPALFRDLVRFFLMIAIILVILNIKFGIRPTALITTSAVLSAIVGFALQDTLSNIFAGIALHSEKPFIVGDWIHIGDLEGIVTVINWRATRIRTLDGNNIIIPNNSLAKDRIINYSKPAKSHAIKSFIGFPYSTAPSLLKKVVLAAANEHPQVLKNPPPQLRLSAYDDFAITYELRFWINERSSYLDIKDDILSRIWYLIKRDNIEIPFPIRTVYMHDGKVEKDHSLEEKKTHTFQLLRSLDIFSPLSEEELYLLIEKGKRLLYEQGELIIKQDEPGSSFFLIENGIVSVFAKDGDSQKNISIKRLERGEIFGEMSLLTGEKRQASILCETDTVVFEINKTTFSDIILKNPKIIETLTSVLTERQLKKQDVIKQYSEKSIDKAREEISRSLLQKIKGFFNLKL